MCLNLDIDRRLNNDIKKSRELLMDSINSAECKFSSIFKNKNNNESTN